MKASDLAGNAALPSTFASSAPTIAAAGYRQLSADEVVGMKAMGVTGEYAQAMNRAAGGVSK